MKQNGIHNKEDLLWAVPGVSIDEISVSYRQSKKLNEFGRGLIKAFGLETNDMELPSDMENEGVSPVLAEDCDSLDKKAEWIAERIREIEKSIHMLPSIAVFVLSKNDVEPMAEYLSECLEEDSIDVIAGQNVGTSGAQASVRVFEIGLIKGLEFEAAFFTDPDVLERENKELFKTDVYVGSTRAATYLGFCCEGTLPELMEDVRPMMTDNWA